MTALNIEQDQVECLERMCRSHESKMQQIEQIKNEQRFENEEKIQC